MIRWCTSHPCISPYPITWVGVNTPISAKLWTRPSIVLKAPTIATFILSPTCPNKPPWSSSGTCYSGFKTPSTGIWFKSMEGFPPLSHLGASFPSNSFNNSKIIAMTLSALCSSFAVIEHNLLADMDSVANLAISLTSEVNCDDAKTLKSTCSLAFLVHHLLMRESAKRCK